MQEGAGIRGRASSPLSRMTSRFHKQRWGWCTVLSWNGGVEELSFGAQGSRVGGRIMEFVRHRGGVFWSQMVIFGEEESCLAWLEET